MLYTADLSTSAESTTLTFADDTAIWAVAQALLCRDCKPAYNNMNVVKFSIQMVLFNLWVFFCRLLGINSSDVNKCGCISATEPVP
jgi:hypothetical protein